MTHKVNEDGKYIKYLYFNEYAQRLYLDNAFFEWVKLITGEIEKALEQLENQKHIANEHRTRIQRKNPNEGFK